MAGKSVGKLWVRNLDSANFQELPNTDGAAYPFWSPDGGAHSAAAGLRPTCQSGKPVHSARTTMTIERRQLSHQVLLLVSGRMDAESASQFDDACRACMAEGVSSLVVDLGDLAYVSSMGLRSFISVSKELQAKGGALRICRLNGLVKQVFQITGLIQFFLVYDSIESAVLGG